MPAEEACETISSTYSRYQEQGGVLSITDYNTIHELSSREVRNWELVATPEKNQAVCIADFCGLEITPEEINAYSVLRTRMPPVEQTSQEKEGMFVPVWTLSDQKLLSQVVLAVEGPGDNYQRLVNAYPNIFDPQGPVESC